MLSKRRARESSLEERLGVSRIPIFPHRFAQNQFVSAFHTNMRIAIENKKREESPGVNDLSRQLSVSKLFSLFSSSTVKLPGI